MKHIIDASITLATAIVAAGAIAWAGGHDGAVLAGVPVMLLCAALAFSIQWVAFVPAYLRRTEHFYDLTGSLTYMTVIGFAITASRSTDPRSSILGLLVFVWALRLGTFLFRRVRAQGSDSRFDKIKTRASSFLIAWTIQGLWVFVTLCAALASITAGNSVPFGWLDVLGVAIWGAGFAIEAIADRQKSRFRAANPGRYVNTGLWSWSRHPNYFGEIVLWIGIALLASSTLQGWQWLTMISPLFVIFLLTQVSGIPMQQQQAEERWGQLDDYRRYRASTSLLIPWPPRR